MNQGDVFWYMFAPPDKRRPVVVLTRSRILPHLRRVTVAPLTTKIRGIDTEVRVGPADGLPTESVVSVDNIQTVVKAKLEQQITSLSPAKLREIRAAIEFAFGFDELR